MSVVVCRDGVVFMHRDDSAHPGFVVSTARIPEVIATQWHGVFKRSIRQAGADCITLVEAFWLALDYDFVPRFPVSARIDDYLPQMVDEEHHRRGHRDVPSRSLLNTCTRCLGRTDARMRRCSGCNSVGVAVPYCSVGCQNADWQRLPHSTRYERRPPSFFANPD
jgi:hypothetical protein